MAGAQKIEIFDCTPEEFYKIVSDYEKYPEFLNEVKKCKVLKTEKNKKLVEYQVSVVKNFTYQLWMTEVPGKKISWEFAGGDIFKTSVGSWALEAEGKGKCKATYEVEATFSMFVPGPIAKALVSVNLPAMMQAYHDRVKKLK